MEESTFKKLLYNQVTFIIAIVSVVATFIFWITNPANLLSQRVGTLETRLEYQTDTLEEIKIKVIVIDNRQIEILQAIAKLQAEHE